MCFGSLRIERQFSKTRILTWDVLAGSRTSVMVFGRDVDILKEKGSERYLGRKLSMNQCQATGLQNRLSAG